MEEAVRTRGLGLPDGGLIHGFPLAREWRSRGRNDEGRTEMVRWGDWAFSWLPCLEFGLEWDFSKISCLDGR